MSATQDKTQKVAFVYSNLYQLYRKGKEAAQVSKGQVLKAEDLKNLAAQTEPKVDVKITAFTPVELIGKRVSKPASIAVAPVAQSSKPTSNPAIESLKDNLKQLNDLRSRLHFMLQELETLTKKS